MKKRTLFILLLSFLAICLNVETGFSNENLQEQTTLTTQTVTETSVRAANETQADVAGREDVDIPPGASTKFLLQLALLLVVIYFGIKFGGVSLGLLGGLGVGILVLVFRDVPGNPPVDVMLIILAVVTTSSTLEATGALGMIVSFAEKVLRKNPKRIVYLAPISTFLLTMMLGTGHAVYTLFPVIYDAAYKQRIRPERPMAVASIAS